MAETEEEAGELRREQEGGSRSLSLYLDELERLNQEEDAPAREVFARAAAGEQEARKELIDWYLPLICRMAGETEDGESPAEDLIQEGNLGLLTALEEMEEMESAAAYQAFLLNRISRPWKTPSPLTKKKKNSERSLPGRRTACISGKRSGGRAGAQGIPGRAFRISGNSSGRDQGSDADDGGSDRTGRGPIDEEAKK